MECRVRNKRICRETQSDPELFFKVIEPDDPILLEAVVPVAVPAHDVEFRIKSTFPFQPPSMLYRGESSQLFLRQLRARVDPLIRRFQLAHGCCSCCSLTYSMWSPTYGMKTVLIDFLEQKKRLENVSKYQTIMPLLKWDDLVHAKILSYF